MTITFSKELLQTTQENATQSEQDYAQGDFHRGSVEDLMMDLEECSCA
jgi:hypothetical protein